MKENFIVVVSTSGGRAQKGWKPWIVCNRIEGLTKEKANEIREAFNGRMTAPNRVDVVQPWEVIGMTPVRGEWATKI